MEFKLIKNMTEKKKQLKYLQELSGKWHFSAQNTANNNVIGKNFSKC